jgi:hypothetical protein
MSDLQYPSKDRSIALVSMGEYHKYLDEFTRALVSPQHLLDTHSHRLSDARLPALQNNYRAVWETKQWSTFPLTECVWVTFVS